MPRLLSVFFGLAVAGIAHPMGNFSINHYARIEVGAERTRLTYILDFAELPTLELLQEWDLADGNARALETKARQYAPKWLANLSLIQDGRNLVPKASIVEAEVTEGAGGMPVLRVGIQAELRGGKPGTLRYKDENYSGRAGWKEIVIRAVDGASITESSSGSYDLSRQLTVYPLDPGIVPPEKTEAFVRWTASTVAARPELKKPEPGVSPEPVGETPQTVTPAPKASFTATSQSANSSAGNLQAGDYLSRLLKRRDLSASLLLIGFAVAFGLGAMHALSPGHGKTIVAAYLVGSRGTIKHAVLLGSTVTFTHTISVFALGVGVLFFQRYVVPEKIIPVLGAISGVSIIAIGAWLLYRRVMALAVGPEAHAHSHAEIEELEMAWAGASSPGGMQFLPPAARVRSSFVHTHTHDGITHSHAVPGTAQEAITPGGLIALGASGGLVPCPSALILMLSSIAVGHTLLGLGLLVSFSAGLAVVLVGIGVLVLYASQLLPSESKVRTHPAFRLIPVFSAVVVIVAGVLMTLTSLGIFQPLRIFNL
jgi:nickel/cobalt exporter